MVCLLRDSYQVQRWSLFVRSSGASGGDVGTWKQLMRENCWSNRMGVQRLKILGLFTACITIQNNSLLQKTLTNGACRMCHAGEGQKSWTGKTESCKIV
jgi:hypothetical protein